MLDIKGSADYLSRSTGSFSNFSMLFAGNNKGSHAIRFSIFTLHSIIFFVYYVLFLLLWSSDKGISNLNQCSHIALVLFTTDVETSPSKWICFAFEVFVWNTTIFNSNSCSLCVFFLFLSISFCYPRRFQRNINLFAALPWFYTIAVVQSQLHFPSN